MHRFLYVIAALLVGALALAAPAPVAEFKASGEAEVYLAFDDGCGPADHCVFDGQNDGLGTSGGTAATTEAGAQNTYVIEGAAATEWEGTGTRDVAVRTEMRSAFDATSGNANVAVYGALGWTLEVTYEGDAGTVDQVFGLSPQPGNTLSTVAVDEYDGHITTVTLRLQCATKVTLTAETLVTQCHLAQFWATTTGTATIPL